MLATKPPVSQPAAASRSASVAKPLRRNGAPSGRGARASSCDHGHTPVSSDAIESCVAGAWAMSRLEDRAAGGEVAQIGRRLARVAVEIEMIRAQRVDRDEHEIRSIARRCGDGRRERRHRARRDLLRGRSAPARRVEQRAGCERARDRDEHRRRAQRGERGDAADRDARDGAGSRGRRGPPREEARLLRWRQHRVLSPRDRDPGERRAEQRESQHRAEPADPEATRHGRDGIGIRGRSKCSVQRTELDYAARPARRDGT